MTDAGRRRLAAGLLLILAVAGLLQLVRSRPLRGFLAEMAYSREVQREHQWGEWFRWAQFVRRVTPPDSLLVIPPHPSLSAPRSVEWYMSHAGLDGYLLFPRRIIHVGESPPRDQSGPIYQVETQRYTGSRFVNHPRQDWERSLVLTRPRTGDPSPPLRDFSEIKPRPWPLAMAAFKLFLLIASGLFLAQRYFETRSWIGLATTAFLVATVQATGIFLVADLVRIPMTEWTQLLWMSGLAWLGLRRATRDGLLGPGGRAPASWRLWLSGALVCAFFGLLVVKAVTMPISGFDGIAVWGPKAKAIFAQHTLRGYGVWGSGPSGPPLVPIAMAQLALGGEAAMNLLFPLFGLAIYATFYDELHGIVRSAMLRTLLPLMLFLAPLVFEHTLTAYTNLAFCAFIIHAVAILPRALEEDRPNNWVALAILLSGAVLVRHEGIVYTGYLGAITGLWIWRRWLPARRGLIFLWPAAAWGVWSAYTAWILHAEALHVPRGAWTGELARTVASGVTHGFLTPSDWGPLTIAFLGLCLTMRASLVARHRVACGFLLLALSGLIVFSFGAVSQWGTRTYFSSGFNRYLMPSVLIMMLIFVKEWGWMLTVGRDRRMTQIPAQAP